MDDMKFQLRQVVQIAASGEQGEVIGRAQYTTGESSYYIRYCMRDGRATEQWWSESALVSAGTN